MSLPPTLEQLDRLDRFSPDFRDQLINVLCGQEYVQCVRSLQGNNVVWLVDYLDMVRHRTALPHSSLKPHRFSVVSILPVTHSESAYTDSVTYVVPG
jgi:hypothetical protein